MMLINLVFLASFVPVAPHTITYQDGILEGNLNIIWGDSLVGSTTKNRFWLTEENGAKYELKPVQQNLNDILMNYNLRKIRVKGYFSTNIIANSGVGTKMSVSLFWVEQIVFVAGSNLTDGSNTTGNQPWISVLCKFKDISDEPRTPSYFQDMYGSSYPRLDHFWREISYSTLNINGSKAVSKWYLLPHPRAYYIYDMNGDGRDDIDVNRTTNDCVGVADSDVDYRSYNGINLMFNGELDGSSWGGSSTLTLDGQTKSWMMTWEPVWGYTNLANLEHEMGHGFGLVHSTAPNGGVYKNEWDLMSDTGSNCSNSTDPVFGCLGQHVIAHYKDTQGWIPPSKVIKVYPGELKTFTLERLANPQTTDKLVIYVPKGDSTSKFFSVEARKKIGYDVKLPGEGVIIHDIDKGRMNQAEVIDIDNNGDAGDDGAIWVPGETYEYVTLEMRIWISIRSATTNGYVVMISNNSGDEIPPPPTPEPTPTPGIRNNYLYLPFTNTDSSP